VSLLQEGMNIHCCFPVEIWKVMNSQQSCLAKASKSLQLRCIRHKFIGS